MVHLIGQIGQLEFVQVKAIHNLDPFEKKMSMNLCFPMKAILHVILLGDFEISQIHSHTIGTLQFSPSLTKQI